MMEDMRSHLRCETCDNKKGTADNIGSGGSFYATNEGIMICTISNEPIEFRILTWNWKHGCASHSDIKEIK